MKDHNIAKLVNDLRDIAVEFHGAQQLRERIAHAIRPLFSENRVMLCAAEPQPKRCKECNQTGLWHCQHPDECGGPWTVSQTDKLLQFANEVKQLCDDYSSRDGNVYILDVKACIDAIAAQIGGVK